MPALSVTELIVIWALSRQATISMSPALLIILATLTLVTVPGIRLFAARTKAIEGGGSALCTTSVAVEVWVSAGLVLVPVTVKTYEPAGVAELVLMVRTEEAPVVGFGLKVALAPVGNPLIDSDTEPVNPPVAVMFSV